LPSSLHPNHNEDAFFLDARRGLAAVIDGMGGHDAGDLAARTGRDTLRQVAYRRSAEGMTWPLVAINAAQEAVLKGQAAHGNDMGATAVVAALEPGRAGLAWCGDARGYGITMDGDLAILTRDHGLVDGLRRAGRITSEQAEKLEEMLDDAPGGMFAESYGREIAGLSDLLVHDPQMVDRWLKNKYINRDGAEQLHEMVANASNPGVAGYLGGKIAGVIFQQRGWVTSGLGVPGGQIGHIVVPTDGMLAIVLMSDGIPDNLASAEISEVVAANSHDLHSLGGALVDAARATADTEVGRAKADDMTALVLPVMRR
jgi:serine/threonine protein phosphatase PrpC